MKRRRSSKRRRVAHRRRNPVNPLTDWLLIGGLVGAAGLGIWYLTQQSAPPCPTDTTPVTSNSAGQWFNAAGQLIPSNCLTAAQTAAQTITTSDSNSASAANAAAAKQYAQSVAAGNATPA